MYDTGSLCCNDSISAIPRMRSGVLFQKVIELCRCAQQCCRLYFQRIGDVIEHLKRKGLGYSRSLDWTDKRTTDWRTFCQLLLGQAAILSERWNGYAQLNESVPILEAHFLVHVHAPAFRLILYIYFTANRRIFLHLYMSVCSQLRTYVLKSIRIIFISRIFSLSKSICIQFLLFLQWPEATGRECVYLNFQKFFHSNVKIGAYLLQHSNLHYFTPVFVSKISIRNGNIASCSLTYDW